MLISSELYTPDKMRYALQRMGARGNQVRIRAGENIAINFLDAHRWKSLSATLCAARLLRRGGGHSKTLGLAVLVCCK
ncbi:MAG: hypothetical protein ACYYK0_06735 [Candidatus Eutrophobiaceae bacterium]